MYAFFWFGLAGATTATGETSSFDAFVHLVCYAELCLLTYPAPVVRVFFPVSQEKRAFVSPSSFLLRATHISHMASQTNMGMSIYSRT